MLEFANMDMRAEGLREIKDVIDSLVLDVEETTKRVSALAKSLDQLQRMAERLQVPVEQKGDVEWLQEAKSIVNAARGASTALLRRKLGVDRAQAARIMELLQREGVVGPEN
jgi:DNA segregation ATPase FtsK/SpoIIIE-like protein